MKVTTNILNSRRLQNNYSAPNFNIRPGCTPSDRLMFIDFTINNIHADAKTRIEENIENIHFELKL
jgi:hypothetical protein